MGKDFFITLFHKKVDEFSVCTPKSELFAQIEILRTWSRPLFFSWSSYLLGLFLHSAFSTLVGLPEIAVSILIFTIIPTKYSMHSLHRVLYPSPCTMRFQSCTHYVFTRLDNL